MEESSPSLLWTIATPVSAVSLAIGVMAVPLTTATIAYMAAPREIATFVDAIDSSVEENENFDCDVAKVPRLEDKIRLGRLLREIQKQVDDLREDLNGLVVEEGGTTLRTGARMLWASHRKQLEDRLRRLDMLRMRFLVSFMGIVAATAGERLKDAARSAPREEKAVPPTPPPPAPPLPMTPISPVSARSAPATAKANPPEYTTPKKPMRRLTTQAMGYSEKTEQTHQASWFNVVAELQMSPMLRQRHASIEAALKSPPPLSPIGSPVSALRPRRGATPIRETIEL